MHAAIAGSGIAAGVALAQNFRRLQQPARSGHADGVNKIDRARGGGYLGARVYIEAAAIPPLSALSRRAPD